jgi:cellulose synthase/poly-beta-1,6-N-acetylglucosamine synthase-like glycosyltransferase
VTLFIDSDCVAHPDVVQRVAQAFEDDPDLVSITGSYDDDPPEKNFFSQYMNLRHHFVHQKAKTEGASFWAGCGAVRTEAFRKISGFDAEQFPMPMIEDIELGLRMKPLGNTRLDKALHVTHLKRWTFWGVVTTDIFSRAVPWGKLILATGEMPNDLNLAWSARLNAAVAPFSLLAVVVVPLAFVLGQPVIAAGFCLPLLLTFVLNREMFAFFARRRGLAFALGATAFHQVHLIYSAVTFAILSLMNLVRPGRKSAKVGAGQRVGS